jgi:hypothetical protein
MTSALFTAEEHITSTIADYEARLAKVSQAIAERHQHLQLRYATDERRQVQDRIRGARAFLAGEYDRTYPGDYSHMSFGGLTGWRAHYADDSLRAALHSLVWAEHYAGLIDRESALAADPYRN